MLSGLRSSCGSPVWVSFHIGRDLLCSCSKAWKHLVFAACCALSLQIAAGHPAADWGKRIPPGSIAFITKTNVFYHPFHPGMKVQRGITRLPALPWWAVLPGAPLPLPEMWKEEQGRQTGAWSDSCPMVLPKRITPQDSLGDTRLCPQVPAPKSPRPVLIPNWFLPEPGTGWGPI